jgi:hypothetical protein
VSLTLSPQIRILALVGVVAILGLGASTMLLGKSKSPAATSDTVVSRVPPRHPAKTPAKTPAKAHTRPTRTHRTATHPVTRPHRTTVKATVKPKPRPTGNLVYSTLPAPLQWALSQHDVVVVSTYDPNADVDSIAVAEAHAGATDASVGFLLVNVLDDAVAGRLTALLPGGGLLPDPGVLVYKAPGNIAFRFDGFVDRATVAQAAANASQGESSPVAG